MLRAGLAIAVVVASLATSVGRAADSKAEVAEIIGAIVKVAREEPGSCERLLLRASPLAASGFKDKEWTALRTALADAGHKVQAVDGGDSHYRCVLLTKACPIRDGVDLDLYVEFWIAGGRAAPTYTVPETFTVYEASVGLSAKLDADHEKIGKEKWFDEQPLIQEAISGWPLAEARASYPILESIDVSFGDAYSFVGEEKQGYRVELVLCERKDEGTDGRAAKRRLNAKAALLDAPAVGRSAVGQWLSRDEPAAGAATRLARELQTSLAAKERSYHVLLREMTHIVHRATSDRAWSAVAKELKGQDLKLVKETSHDFGMHRQYLLAERSYCTPSGQHMDVILNVDTRRATSKDAPTREVVSEAYPLLRARLSIPYERAAEASRFGKDTAIHRALLHEETREAVKACSIVDAVDVHYGVVLDRWRRVQSWGFSVRVLLREDKPGDVTEASLSFSCDSELDPPQVGGAKVLIKDFVPRDAIDEPRYWGGSTSQRSTAANDGDAKGSFFLTRRGAARWRRIGGSEPKPAIAYSVGDLKALPAVTRAIVVKNREIYDDDLTALSRFASLESLDLGDAEGITDKGLARLAGLSKLKSVTLSGEVLTGAGIAHFGGMKSLAVLKVHSAERITDEGIANIAKLGGLKILSLHWASGLTDGQLEEVAKLRNLQVFNIWNCPKVTDAGLAHIAKLGQLEDLQFSKANVSPAGMAHLVRLKNLRELTVGYMPLKDDALATISRIASLEYVTVHGLAFSDKGIQQLAGLKRLKNLYLHDCGVSAKGMETLKTSLGGDYEIE